MRNLIFIGLLSAVVACSKTTADVPAPVTPPPLPQPPPPAATQKTYLALGDSYTIGQSVSENQRFPAQTVALLRSNGISVTDPVYIAQTGWTTGNLQAAIAAQNPPSTFDVVSLLIGVNDQYQHQDTSGYAERFSQLLQKAIQLAGGNFAHVFVLSIPDYSVTPFVPESEKERVRREIDWFNEINKRITTAASVSYTDITPASREAATNPALIAGDGLHPSGQQYKLWVQLLAPRMKEVLK